MEYQTTTTETLERPVTDNAAPRVDAVETTLRGIAYNVFTGAFALLPLLFLPIAYAPFDYTKALFIILAGLVATIFFSLSILRSGRVTIAFSWPLLALWLVAAAAMVSALLSGDMYDALIGDTVSVHSALFVGLMAMVVTLLSMMGNNKSFIMRMYIALAGSAVLVGLFQLTRVILGPDVLTFGVFQANTSALIGGWNDLALFFGLIVLLSLVALEQLPLTKIGRGMFMIVVFVSLLMLMVVNFFAVWMVLALVSLMVLMYSLTKDRFVSSVPSFSAKPAVTMSSIVLSAAVFVVSLSFVIGGNVIGGMVSNVTGISYVEVRPSLSATIDIAREVYKENALVGIGTNKFVDAWRLYKDPALNQTIFWATDFVSGSGYVTTQFVTMGVLGGLAWIAFLVLFVFYGLRMILKATYADRFWYFIGTSSFVAATYLWVMGLIYTPGVAVMLLTALFTGITFAASAALTRERVYTWSIEQNRRAGFALVGAVMLIIVGSASSLYYIGRHYAAVYSFSGAVNGLDGSETLEQVEQKIVQSFTMVQSDQFARQLALYQLSKMNALMGVTEPTPEQQQLFQQAAANGVNAAQQAVAVDPTNPQNTSTLGGVYSVLAAAGVEGAADRAKEAYAAARAMDPTNPSYALLEAQLLARTGNAPDARAKIAEAVALRPNYTDALLFLTQLDVAEGKVGDAIVTTRSIISMEPNNPARYYQLGVLLSSDKKLDEAIAAFKQAVTLDPNYANARYFLALGYAEKGDTAAAITQLEAVAVLNPDNADIKKLIDDLKSGRPLVSEQNTETGATVTEGVPVATDGETVTTSEAPDTSLIVPVNPVGDDAEPQE